jgi:ABC-type glycerol-3-phosphate transport system substrate-binding protein
LVLVAAGCGGSPSGGSATGPVKGTLTVWDYYGSATPIKPAVRAFQKLHPKLKINYQAIDYDSFPDKFSVGVSSGAPPDLATLDMTWIPRYAANRTLSDLSALSDDKVDGKPISSLYSNGANNAMKYGGQRVTLLYDFDAYALYYRADVLRDAGVAVPKTWTQFRAAAKKVAQHSGGKIRYGFQVLPDTFHFAQFLFQNGGSILSPDNQRVEFNSPAGVQALTFMKGFLDDGSGVYWGPDQGDSSGIAGIKDQRIAMFANGPYMMGILKDSAPEQSGKWRVAPAPISRQPGSYLGGTGLVIPANAQNKSAAWAFAQFLLTPREQLNVYKYAGAAPATEAALASPTLTKPDRYFGGQAPFKVFRKALATATPFPYVKSWNDIDTAITDGVTSALLGKQSPSSALNSAASRTKRLLGGG